MNRDHVERNDMPEATNKPPTHQRQRDKPSRKGTRNMARLTSSEFAAVDLGPWFTARALAKDVARRIARNRRRHVARRG